MVTGWLGSTGGSPQSSVSVMAPTPAIVLGAPLRYDDGWRGMSASVAPSGNSRGHEDLGPVTLPRGNVDRASVILWSARWRGAVRERLDAAALSPCAARAKPGDHPAKAHRCERSHAKTGNRTAEISLSRSRKHQALTNSEVG